MPRKRKSFILEAAVAKKHGALVKFASLDLLQEIAGRMCRIYNGTVTGSGFLVAPDLIMTAHHVIDNVSATSKPNDPIRFSFSDSVNGPERDCYITETGGLMVVAQSRALDYAIVRMPIRLGLSRYDHASNQIRGGFTISDNQLAAPLVARSLMLLQFPLVQSTQVAPDGGEPAKHIFAFTSGEIVGQQGNEILEHNADTEVGSSGGICLTDRTMIPFALHIGSDRQNANVAVAISCITHDLLKLHPAVYDELRSTPSRTLCPRMRRNGLPILNRDGVITKLISMMSGLDQRPIYVRGASQSGRTFIKEIVDAFKPDHLHRHFEMHLSLEDYKSAIRRIIKSARTGRVRLPAYNPVEQIEAFFRRSLDYILQAIDNEAHLRHRLVFVFFDGLDVDTPVARDLLTLLVKLASRYQNIRIGISGSIPPPEHTLVDVCVLGSIKRADYEVFATEYCEHNEIVVEKTMLNIAIEELLNSRDIEATSLAIQAEMAHDLCLELPIILNGVPEI